jgi:hypothetical protein
MTWAWWKGNAGTADTSADAEEQAPEREIPLCGVGSRVSAVVVTEAEPDGFLCHATVAVLDGDSIVLRTTGEIQPSGDAQVTLQWAVDSGQRWVAATIRSTSASTWTLTAVGDVSHRQRRRWVRVPAAVTVQARRPGGQAWLAGRTVNLSGGGMSADFDVRDDELTGGDEAIELELGLPSGGLTLTGTLFEVTGDEAGSHARIGFSGAEESALERLAEYVFQVQREELARRRAESLLMGS